MGAWGGISGQRTPCGYGTSDAKPCTDVHESVCVRERERERDIEPCACISECHSRWSADVFATLMLRFVQICLSTVQTEALHLLKLRCPGLIQMCRDESHLHVSAR